MIRFSEGSWMKINNHSCIQFSISLLTLMFLFEIRCFWDWKFQINRKITNLYVRVTEIKGYCERIMSYKFNGTHCIHFLWNIYHKLLFCVNCLFTWENFFNSFHWNSWCVVALLGQWNGFETRVTSGYVLTRFLLNTQRNTRWMKAMGFV